MDKEISNLDDIIGTMVAKDHIEQEIKLSDTSSVCTPLCSLQFLRYISAVESEDLEKCTFIDVTDKGITTFDSIVHSNDSIDFSILNDAKISADHLEITNNEDKLAASEARYDALLNEYVNLKAQANFDKHAVETAFQKLRVEEYFFREARLEADRTSATAHYLKSMSNFYFKAIAFYLEKNQWDVRRGKITTTELIPLNSFQYFVVEQMRTLIPKCTRDFTMHHFGDPIEDNYLPEYAKESYLEKENV